MPPSGAITLEARVERLEAYRAIEQLKARYTQLADAKYTSRHERVEAPEWLRIARQQAACFCDDAEWDGGSEFGGRLRGHAALAEWFGRSPWRFAMHFYVAAGLELVEPGRAQGRWRLWQVALPLAAASPILLAGVTHESYRATASGWLIQSMRFEEIHTIDLSRMPVEFACVMQRVTP